MQRWLSPPDPRKNHQIARKSRHGTTGAWFIESDTFSEWKSPGLSSLLWIYGKRQSPLSYCIFAKIDRHHTLQRAQGKVYFGTLTFSRFCPENLRCWSV